MFGAEHAAPGLSEQEIAIVDAEEREQILELVQEQVDGPEVATLLGHVRRSPATELVVVHDGSPTFGEFGQREHVVVRAARSAVRDDQGRRTGLQVAGDSVPGLPLTKGREALDHVCRFHGPTVGATAR